MKTTGPQRWWGPIWRRSALALMAGWMALTGMGGVAADSMEPLRVVCSTPDLESLAKTVGGKRVVTFCFSKGPEDPHTIELKPSFVRELDRADIYLQVGLGIENAWLEDLMKGVRNAAVKPGGKGNLNLGMGVRPLEGLEGKPVPGSFHEEGNPHYFLDPVEGLKAARAIRDRLVALRPAFRADFEKAYETFRLALGTWLAGEECAKNDDVEALALKLEVLKPSEIAAFQKEHALGGFLGSLMTYRGRRIVGDHDLWPYFARRCGLEILGYLEPSPGVPPTTKHLQELIGKMKEQQVKVILTNPYFEPRHAAFVGRATGAVAVPMAHQTGARPGTDDYLAMLQYNGKQLIEALGAKP